MNPIIVQINAIARLCTTWNISLLDLLAIRLALTDALETLDRHLGKPAAAPGLRGEVFALDNFTLNARGECSGFILLHQNEHGDMSAVPGHHYENVEDAEAAAARVAKQLGARYEPAPRERPIGGEA